MQTYVPKGTFRAVPASALGANAERYPAMTRSQVEAAIGIDTMGEFPLYAGHTWSATETTYRYFEQIAAAESTESWTNLKTAGKLPFDGSFKVNGIAMLITPLHTTYGTELTAQIRGSAVFKSGSEEGTQLKLPLEALFTQEMKCCTGSPSLSYMVSNTKFVGRKGYFAMPNGPEINPNATFNVTVTLDAALGGTPHLKMFFFLFGYRVMPLPV